jgi:hypothetical protein
MRTVKSLIVELQKFPDDAVCYAYEGEVTGIIIERQGHRLEKQGFISCSETDELELAPADIEDFQNAAP